MDIAIKGVTFNMILIVLLTIIIAMSLYYSSEPCSLSSAGVGDVVGTLAAGGTEAGAKGDV